MHKLRKFLKILGPGFITGASDDDPSGIGTYSQTGAQFGYQQLWLALFSFPFMAIVQEMCGRIGIVTGKGLSGVIKHHYPRPILYGAVFLLFLANTINIGANLGAMTSALLLIVKLPFFLVLIAITVLTILLEVFVKYKIYASYLKYLTLSLFAYIAVAFVLKVEWNTVFQNTFIPTIQFDKSFLMNIVAILGTTISPYLFFWQTGEEVEEEVEHHKLRMMGKGIPRVGRRDIFNMRIDTITGMFLSNVIMWFIIIATASTLNKNGITEIATAADAATALQPIAGNFASILFAAGIVGTGLLSIPILAGSASYAMSETFGWKEGLYRKFDKAINFYIIIVFAILLGFLISFTPLKPFNEPFKMLYYTAILNGLVAPVLLFFIIRISSNKEIMGKNVNAFGMTVMGWVIMAIMAFAAIFLLASFFV